MTDRYDPLLEMNLDELKNNETDYLASEFLKKLSEKTDDIGVIEFDGITLEPGQVKIWLMELSKQVQEISTLEHQTRVMGEHLE